MTSAALHTGSNRIVEFAEGAGISYSEASRRLTIELMTMPPHLHNQVALPLMCVIAFAVAFASAQLI